ncbi:MAG: CarD family transcriptional regulator [Clostridia bacterium]|nr:CarD family transcriptional regulator [Clostridia bacterium]
MLKKGDLVVYGAEGICEVLDISTQGFRGMSDIKTYYILEPKENKSSRLYVPVDNDILCSKIKKLLDFDSLEQLICHNTCRGEWISDNKLRNKLYKELLSTYNREEIIATVKMLCEIKDGKNSNVKKLYTMDEEFLKKALQILFMELSHILIITQEQLLPYLLGEIKCARKLN